METFFYQSPYLVPKIALHQGDASYDTDPHSLGKLIEWKLPKRDVADSQIEFPPDFFPLVGETN